MIWIIGEYAERIENANELLDSFLESFKDESTQVQLQLLTAIVKLFLKRPKDTTEMVQKVLNLATQETDNPDLRDRGYVYWRLLSTDPEAAKAVVLGEKPLISDSTTRLDESLLDDLLNQLSTLSSIYHKPPESFVTKLKDIKKPKKEKRQKNYDESLLPQEEEGSPASPVPTQKNILDLDILGEALPSGGSAPGGAPPANLLDDFFAPQPTTMAAPKEIALKAQEGKGMQISYSFSRKDNKPFLDMTFSNQSSAPLSAFAIQFNKNSFGFSPSPLTLSMVMPGQSVDASVFMEMKPAMLAPGPASPVLQIAVKNNIEVFYFQITFPIWIAFLETGLLGRDEYLNLWRSIPEESSRDVSKMATTDPDLLLVKLQRFNIYYVARRNANNQDFLYFSAKVPRDETVFLLEITIDAASGRSKTCTKSKNPEMIPFFEQGLHQLLAQP